MNRKETFPELTVIVPCYNEAQIIEETFPRLQRFLETIQISYEIIIIDDCSKDNTVAFIQKMIGNRSKIIQFIQHSQNKGRGYTVREGISLAKGTYVGFIDIDLEVPEFYILPAIMKLRENKDIVIGQRFYRVTLSFSSLLRWSTSRGYNKIIRYILKLPLTDTETGFKFFKRDRILPIIRLTENNHWFWDTEIVALSYYKNLKIEELPVVFTKVPHKISTVRIVHDTLTYFQQLLKFRKKIRKL